MGVHRCIQVSNLYFCSFFKGFQRSCSTAMSKRRAVSTAESKKKRRKAANDDLTLGNESLNSKVTTLVEKVGKELLKNADHKRSQPMKKYMRGKFEFFGLSSPLRRSVCKEFLQQKLSPQETRKFVALLWAKPQREFQYFAIDYLEKHMDTSAEFEANMECIKSLITSKSWWDTVDALASKIVGGFVRQHRDVGKNVMEEWIDHENMWLRRTALLHQLSYKEETDEEMLFRFCSLRAEEEEFFIRKAIGWALRQYAWTCSSSVKKYLLKHKKKLSNLSFKEAAKHLNM